MAARKTHPSLDIVSSHGSELAGKRIVLCVTGSVAAYKAIELARLLMRHGADVTCVASGATRKLIQPEYFKWATGNEVITKLTGNLEHIRLADYGQSDLVVAYPATANTLGKLAGGIDDTPVSTVLTVALGSGIPILMCLAMHESMYENAAVKRNIGFLQKSVQFVGPNRIEGKAKAPEPEDVLEAVLGRFGTRSVLRGKRVLITAGPTIEFIDPVRGITNSSSGKTGVLLASEMVLAGAEVTMVYGPGIHRPPDGVKVINVTTSRHMQDAIVKLRKKFDVVIMAAAVSDYMPVRVSGKKTESADSLTIKLKRAPKIIDTIKKHQRDAFLVGFKAETDVSDAALVKSARKKMAESKADLMVANDIGRQYQKNPDMNRVIIVGGNGTRPSGRMRKERIARFIRKEIERRLK